MMSCNYFGFEQSSNKDGCDSERTIDRVSVIPFKELPDIAPAQFAAQQRRFKAFVDDDQMAAELLIGELGDWFHTQEFVDKRNEFTELLTEICEDTIKLRTLSNNYATSYAVLWFLHRIFEPIWTEKGYSWEGFLKWTKDVQVPFMMQQHQEKDHAKYSIRRYFNAIMILTVDWTVLERRKLMKFTETAKLKNGEKYCLAFHPSKTRMEDLKELGGLS